MSDDPLSVSELPDVAVPQEISEEALAAQKELYLGIFYELNQSKRFVEFLNNNYDIQQIVDEETKTIDVRVIEMPTARGPKLGFDQIRKLHSAVVSAGVIDATLLVNKIMTILGQETSNIIGLGDVAPGPKLIT